jgi:hypothetical protein
LPQTLTRARRPSPDAYYKDDHGHDSDDALVIRTPTSPLNPTINSSIVEQTLRDDPAARGS